MDTDTPSDDSRADVRHDELRWALCDEVEAAWCARRDFTAATRLASRHPEHADLLLDFLDFLLDAHFAVELPPDMVVAMREAAERRPDA